jgi:2-keto-3-deoxy-L-rhamnonate aldolase RhmA
MSAYPNHTKTVLQAGGLALGMGVRLARTVDIVPIAKTSGFDWLFIDMEHGALDVETAGQIALAALPAGVTPLVRVPGPEHYHASRLLDAGAQGIVVPHVDTPEQARRAVAQCKYPPIGERSVGGPMAQCDFRSLPVGEAMHAVNEQTLAVVMLETPQAIDNVEAIAAVPGLDVILVGTGDLCVELGIPGEVGHPRIEQAYRRVLKACAACGVHPGMGGAYDPPALERYVRLGMRFILSGSDTAFLMAGARDRSSFLRGVCP